jgi:hypothetical protein
MMFKNQLFDASEIVRSHAPVAGQPDGRLQPELTLPVRRPHVDVRRLPPLIRVEVEPEGSDSQDRRHGNELPCARRHRDIFCRTAVRGQARIKQCAGLGERGRPAESGSVIGALAPDRSMIPVAVSEPLTGTTGTVALPFCTSGVMG